MTDKVTVRRQWAPWRTPWVWRKLRSRSKPHRGYAAGRPPTFSFNGGSGEAGSFVIGALNQLVGGSPINAVDSAHPGAFLAGQLADVVVSDAADAVLSVAFSSSGSSGGGGGGGGGGFLDDLDEAALVIIAIVAVVVFLIVAIPLGILAVELVFALIALLVGVALRMAHVRPWTILVRQDGATTAAFSVTGWRSSRRVLVGLRQQSAQLATIAPRPGIPVPPAPGPGAAPAA